ncbi:MAG: hypothetical protein A3E79_00520 [Burkholderiales bacterium RIFCSPHIGHO2_12_FULL_61_11]|nr:MAG: hypothetical protein A3E79_00520 [Burkholderiales bacterium RIFCSPHIGHO2_12_FULL_61_11]
MSDVLLGYLLAVCALLLFTAGILVTKVASDRIPLNLGFLIAASTNVVFSALALALELAMRVGGVRWDARAFWLFAAAGAFSTYLGRWFLYESVVRFGPAKASIFQVNSPLFTAVIAWSLLDERLTLLVALGMFLTIGGLMLVSYQPGFFSRRKVIADQASRGIGMPMRFHEAVRGRMVQSVLLLGLGSSLAYASATCCAARPCAAGTSPCLARWWERSAGWHCTLLSVPVNESLWPVCERPAPAVSGCMHLSVSVPFLHKFP